MEPVYRPVIAAARGLFALQGNDITRIGADNIPATGGAVIALNHIGYLDFAYGGFPAVDVGRLVRFMAKKEVFDHKITGPLMRGMKHIPVDRAAGASAYREAVRALRGGELIGVFPEATISRSFELKDFKLGAVRMAQEAGVPILPMVVWGSQRVWTKDHPKSVGKRRHVPITVRVGPAIPVPSDADTASVTAQVKAAMGEMLHEVQDSYPRLTGDDLVYLPARLGGTAPTPERARELDSQEAADKIAKRRAKAAAKAAKSKS
ncbi:lysophospholipid acyltransferase family protein [Allobranchiibius huperziae]|uniref:1-acyl-sn-glycerol-3-phosphate acyltransferase n=1 Tax=Allobranchiibius huperziae TaxID=1874116 RepID=A0A853DKM9_9MICO|nr:lysophospholipid acyltransferase family protein [Allobranchiibius huperziae]NYJ74715.1 1-acyl-sn-glycerol-3-phosphate acyltransferase [Allobranchiibius huperziae]